MKEKKQRRTKQFIDCDQCSAYGCYEDDENVDDGQVNKDELDNQVSEWIANLAECQETGVQWNNMNLYVSAMCSPYGDGVEFAVFVDEDCTMYTNQKAFNSVYNPYYNGEKINYLYYAEDYIKTAFSSVMPCLEQEFANPNEEQNGNEEEEEKYEVNEYCEGIFNDGAADFNNCQGGNAEEEANQDDQYNWYTFDMTAENAEDIDEVCYTINKMSGEYYHVYDEVNSGTWYSRNKSGHIMYTLRFWGLLHLEVNYKFMVYILSWVFSWFTQMDNIYQIR